MKRSTIRDENIQKAIIFLVKKFEESGDNEKPVTLHSIRVGMYLDSNEHSTKTIVADILHDLLEDTKVERKEIETTIYYRSHSRSVSTPIVEKTNFLMVKYIRH